MITKESLNFKKILWDKNIDTNARWKKRAHIIASQWPGAEIIPVSSYWKNDYQLSLDPEQWVKHKRDYLVLGVRKSMTFENSGRSTDFISPSHVSGCLSACQYCYHARRTIEHGQGANLLTYMVNITDIGDAIFSHVQKQGKKLPNQCDEKYWTYDIGNVNDVTIDAMIGGNPYYLIDRAAKERTAKLCFATKSVYNSYFTEINPQGMTRIRFSLMPQEISTAIDIRTSKILDRIRAVNELVEAGYEVHFNFSPVVIYDNYLADWEELFNIIDRELNARSKSQLACEVIFLTHSEALHDVNMQWNPKGESYLWQPKIQQPKENKPDVICYTYGYKGDNVRAFNNLIRKVIPYCRIRYSF